MGVVRRYIAFFAVSLTGVLWGAGCSQRAEAQGTLSSGAEGRTYPSTSRPLADPDTVEKVLLGRPRGETPEAPVKSERPPSVGRVVHPAVRTGTGPTKEDLKRLYDETPSVAPESRIGQPSLANDDAANARDPGQIQKTVGKNQGAFQFCIEQELKQNPKFHGGKIHIVASLASSGAVTKARIDRREIDGSQLGRCLKDKARRMTFPAADEDTEVEIPLILAGS